MLEMMFIIAIVVEIGLPIALAFFLVRKLKSSWAVVGVGALAFIISQVVHLPIVVGLQSAWTSEQYLALPQFARTLIYGITLGVLAGICEEPMRWLSYRLLREKGKNVQTGVLLGVGHGGIESIALVGFSVLANFVIMLSIRNSGVEVPGITPDMVSQFFSMPWYMPLAGAIERISALGLHIGLSMMVWQSVKNRSWFWFIGAVLVHALFDAMFVIASAMGLGTWAIEFIFMLMSAMIVIWTVRTVKQELATKEENPSVLAESI